jgi:hypothetical protein
MPLPFDKISIRQIVHKGIIKVSQLLKKLDALSGRAEIEAWVSTLSVDDSVELVYTIALDPAPYKDKVEPILAGLPVLAFLAMLSIGEKKLLNFFKPYMALELFQHKLMFAGSQLKAAVDSLEQAALDLLNHAVDDENETVASFKKKGEVLQKHAHSLNETLKHFLEVVWSTERPDLIDPFSSLREDMLRLKGFLETLPTKLLEARNQIFKAPDQSLPIEALADLGWFYPQDLKDLAVKLGCQETESPEAISRYLNDYFSKKKLANVAAFKSNALNRKKSLLQFLGIA